MLEHSMRRILEGGGGLPGGLVRAGLWLPGKIYGAAMACRRIAYERGLFRSYSAPLPAVSVGNLTAGGSGKTPFIVLLVELLGHLDAGRVAILLRGYRRDASGFSDEATLYLRQCPDAIVKVGADRVRSAMAAAAEGAAVLLLDDGFQHVRLARDLDIVLVDATSPWGGGNTIPGGLLREPVAALGRAGAVVITRSDQAAPEAVAALKNEVARLAPGAELFTARHRPARLHDLAGADMPLEAIRGASVLALSGIARPEAFQRTLADLGAAVVDSVQAPDHAGFDSEFMQQVIKRADAAGAIVVVTEKDRTKQIFADLADNTLVPNGRILTLAVRQEVDDRERLMSLLARTVNKCRMAGGKNA